MGIFLGSTLRTVKHIKLTSVSSSFVLSKKKDNCQKIYRFLLQKMVTLGHFVAFVSWMLAFFGPAFMGNMDYVYNPVDAAWYAAFAPILWCLAFAWIIFSNYYGHKSYLSYFFSLKIFRVWTKISYAVYLTQFPIYFFNVGQARASREYSFLADMVRLLKKTLSH